MTTLTSILDRSARNFPDEVALLGPGPGDRLTYRALRERSLRWAGAIAAAGVGKGDRVGLLFGNVPEFAVAFFAALYAGGVAVPVNARLTPREASAILGHAETRAVLCGEGLRDLAATAPLAFVPAELDAATAERPERRAEPGDDAEVLYTSGTTGDPKGVVMTHGAALETAAMAAYEFGMRVRERVAVLMPLTHSAPLNLFLLGSVYTGSTVVLGTFDPRNPAAMLQTLQDTRSQYLFAAPVAYLLALRADPSRYDLSAMRLFVYGGAPMPREQVQAVRGAFGGRWMSVYGLTESGPNGMALSDQDHLGHEGSIGWHPTVNVEVRLVDEAGRDVPQGQPGELIMRTESAMRGYLGNPAATAEVLRDGWVHTGDMTMRDDAGYYWILDRKKDLILSGGYNVYPREVEEAVLTHPAVAEAAVVATPHPDWGETVTAVVVLKSGFHLTLEELRVHLQDRLSSQKQPRRLEVVESLPRNPTGKLLRHELRRRIS